MATWDEEFPAPEEVRPLTEDYPQPAAEQEFTPPGHGGAAPAPKEKKSRLRKLLYAAAAAVMLLPLFRGSESLPQLQLPQVQLPGPVQQDLPPEETAAPVSDGSVPYLNITYAVLPAEEPVVHYCYFSFPCMTDPSVEAYISVSDDLGGVVQSPDNPDVWEHSRDRMDYTVDVSALQGENMVLTVAARYDAGNGEEREVTQSLPVTRLSPAPEIGAYMDVYKAGGAARIDYIAKFLPQEGDSHHYDLTVEEFWLGAYDVSGENKVYYAFGESEYATEFLLPQVETFDDGGYAFTYVGPYPGWHMHVYEEVTGISLETYNVVLVLKDQSTGAYYTVETEKALISELPAPPDAAPEPTPDITSTEFQCQLVFFNFSAFHHGFVKLFNQDEITAGTVEIWEKNFNSLEWSHELTPEEIAEGYYEIPEFDDSDTYFKYMDEYSESNGMPELELRVTLTREGENGTETLSYSQEPSYEQGWGVRWWPEDYEPVWVGQEYYPGCFAVMSYESYNEPVRMRPGGYQEAEMTGEICVELRINGVLVPTNGVTVHSTEEPLYTVDEHGDYVPTGDTLHYSSVVFERPEDAPPSGTAEFTVYQKLEGYDIVWVTHREIEYGDPS